MNVDRGYEIIQEVSSIFFSSPSVTVYAPREELFLNAAGKTVRLWPKGSRIQMVSKIEAKSTLPPCRPAGQGKGSPVDRPSKNNQGWGARLKQARGQVVPSYVGTQAARRAADPCVSDAQADW